MSASAVDALHVMREETQRTISTLRRDLDAVVDASTDTNADDEHDPEGSTIAFERAQLGALLDSARHTLTEVDNALARVEAGSYGRCEICAAAIDSERLEARPAARWCVTCAAAR
jgi:DnaK suppressor protein